MTMITGASKAERAKLRKQCEAAAPLLKRQKLEPGQKVLRACFLFDDAVVTLAIDVEKIVALSEPDLADALHKDICDLGLRVSTPGGSS